MPNLNYPFDQDLAFNSFIITDPNAVTGVLGRPYNQNELVPVSYPKIITKSFTDISITWIPVQEFVYIADPDVLAKFQNESASDIQGTVLKLALTDLYNYWKDQLLNNGAPAWATPLNSPLIVVTPREPQLLQDNGTGNFHLILKFDLVTYVLPTSIYA